MNRGLTTIAIRVTPDTANLIKGIAAERASTTSQFTRQLLENFCKEYTAQIQQQNVT